MNLKRTATIALGGAALAAWFSAAMTPSSSPVISTSVVPGPMEARGAELASEIARLHERLRPQGVPREPTRNLFAFRSTRRAASTSAATTARLEIPSPAPLPAPRLALTLAGLAEEAGAANVAPVRTAIISGNGQLFLAREGDTVTDRDIAYKVGKISADSVELMDVRDGTKRTLTLR